MRPIRILNVVGRMDRGGIETLIMNIYRNIDKEQIHFDFLAHYNKKDADYNEEIKNLGGKIFEMPQIKTTTKANYHMIFKYRKALKKFFVEHQEYQIIHIHMTNTASILIPIAKKYGNVKVVISHSHLTRAKEGLIGIITNYLQRKIEKEATDYFACSLEAAKWFYSENLINKGKVKIVNNGIDSSKFKYSLTIRDEIRNKFNLNDKFVIGHVGRFFPQKNHKFIIDIFEQLLTKNKKSILILIGEGTLMNDIKKYVRTKGISENVLFLGNRSDVHLMMQSMDVFLMPSLFEGLPVVGVEAQASGLPCVFSDSITREVDITNTSSFVSLNSSLSNWVDAVLKYKDFDRKNTENTIIANGYDIKKISSDLQNYYLERLKDNE
jgi:glycosyltransferase involved in cell wall biosynthesis